MEFMSMIVTGIVLARIISGLSFVVGKLSGLSWFWIAFCANSGFFIIFITVQNSFPDNDRSPFVFKSWNWRSFNCFNAFPI